MNGGVEKAGAGGGLESANAGVAGSLRPQPTQLLCGEESQGQGGGIRQRLEESGWEAPTHSPAAPVGPAGS